MIVSTSGQDFFALVLIIQDIYFLVLDKVIGVIVWPLLYKFKHNFKNVVYNYTHICAYCLLRFVCSMKMDLQMFQKDKYTMEYDC